MSKLVLVRHGESAWNASGTWTGLTDVELTEKGRQQARDAGSKIKETHFDLAFTSVLKRAKDTLLEILNVIGQTTLPITEHAAINERDYGIYTGQNKWQVKEKYGEETFRGIRRGWDYPIPEGENLKAVYERVVPYYQQEILPKLKEGKNILIAAHGNSLRALVKYLENIADEAIADVELATGEVYVYEIDGQGMVKEKQILK